MIVSEIFEISFMCNIYNHAKCFFQRACKEEIEWYKSIKDTLGSMVVSTFGQMRDINELGVFVVGSTTKKIHFTLPEVIHLEFAAGKKTITKSECSLDELRDLESKLVLITGKNAKEREEVDKFLDVSLCVMSVI